MNYPKYLSLPEDSFLIYRFTSAGPKGLVQKTVTYSPTDVENVYNLGFGDYNPITKTVNDLSITNNGDSYKVLATVASTVNVFMDRYPKAWIVISGSTPARTRLYRIAINNNFSEISEDFVIFGYDSDGDWERFMAGKAYDIFLITKKENEHALWKRD